MTRDEKIKYCKECVEYFNDYYYVKWDVMEDYQIDHWINHFKQLLKLTLGNIHKGDQNKWNQFKSLKLTMKQFGNLQKR